MVFGPLVSILTQVWKLGGGGGGGALFVFFLNCNHTVI
jgi:hypothetical protein